MIKRSCALAIFSAVAISPALSGCVTVFPQSKPAELYRFEAPPGQPIGAPARRQQSVLTSPGTFSAEAAGDRLVAVSNGQVAYVRGIRWAAPAEELFRDAVVQTFQHRQGETRLIERGDAADVAFLLRWDVNRFELQYPPDAATPPTAVVVIYASLFRAKDRVVVAQKAFEARALAPANRLSSFASTYDLALGQAVSAMADWVDANVAV